MSLPLPVVSLVTALLTVIAAFYKQINTLLFSKLLNENTKLVENPLILRPSEYVAYQTIKYGAGIKSAALSGSTLVLIDPELIKCVNQKDFHHFQDRHPPSYHSDPTMNKMLSFATGEEWKSLKAILTQAFSTTRIRRVYQGLEESALKLVHFIRRELSVRDDSQLEIVGPSTKYLLELIACSVFGLENTDIFNSNDDSPFEVYTKEVQNSMIRHRQARQIPGMLRLAKLFGLIRPDPKAIAFFKSTIEASINARTLRGEKGDDLLQLLVEPTSDKGVKHGLDADSILPQALMFFFAGTEGPATLLIYGLYELAMHPEVQEKLYDEIATAVGAESALDYETLYKLPYLDMFVSEVLRMYSSSVTARRCSAKYNVPGTELKVLPGTIVHTPIYGIHHDDEFYPNPFQFNPENFSEEAKAKRPASAYMPFGIGPRSCIAQKFGLVQGKSAICQLVKNFKVARCERTETPPKGSIESLFLPANGLWLRIEDRRNNNNDSIQTVY